MHQHKEMGTSTTDKLFAEILKLYNSAKQIEEKRRRQGDFFNIFNIIGLRSEEVRLHSALIAELLDPRGSHGAGSHFLKAFLRLINIEDDYIDYKSCSTDITERVIGAVTETEGGRIDIIIEDGNHAIIIENKIFAKDQRNQLLRYHNYGKDMFPKGFHLLYLTLDGHEPNKSAIGEEIYNYKIISYENEIINWLEECYNIASGKHHAQATIKQYCELVKQLTHKDMSPQYVQQLKSLMLAPENILSVGEILKMQDEWINGVFGIYIWEPLKQFAEEKGLKFEKQCGYGESGAWIYKDDWKHYAIFIWTTKRNSWDDMCIGVSWYGTPPNRKCKIFKKDFQLLNCLDEAPNEDWPYGCSPLPKNIKSWGYHITEEIVQGKVFNHIKEKFTEILHEIEERQLLMP